MTGERGAARIFLIAGEESGDRLGAGLMRALRTARGGLAFEGIGGDAMASEGLRSLFPLGDITAMGVVGILGSLPRIVRRGLQVVDAIGRSRPDLLVVIDSPDFTHSVARLVRRRLPDLPVVNYVSPSVWAWRPGRARRMRRYVDHVLALLPFEPEAHRRLGGPPCTYVGHPLVETIARLRPAPGERPPRREGGATLLVLPGSRRSEIARLMAPFGETAGRLRREAGPGLEIVIPAVTRLADEIRARAASWPVPATIVVGDLEKEAAFRRAHLALAASGTVTLELALAGVPMVVAYRVSKLEEPLRRLVSVPSIVLANLVLGETIVPEFIQADVTPVRLSAALRPLLRDGPERVRQTDAFARLDRIMDADAPTTPSERAAAIVLGELDRRQA